MANSHHDGGYRTMFECIDQNPESVPGSLINTQGAFVHHVEVKCNDAFMTESPVPHSYNTQKEVTCVVCTK